MMRLLPLFFLFAAFLAARAENLTVRTDLFMGKSDGIPRKKTNEILQDPTVSKLFSAAVVSAPDAKMSFSLLDYYRHQRSGFFMDVTAGKARAGKKNYRISTDLKWNFAEDGPYLASGTESFYEGTRITNVRHLLPDTFSPLEIVKAKSADRIYIPAITFSREGTKAERCVFRRGEEKEWEIVLTITEEGKEPRSFRVNPVYHHRTFPAKTEPAGLQCRMYDFDEQGELTVLNLIWCGKRGDRKDGFPVLEQISLSLAFEAPERNSSVVLADLISFCSDGESAYGKFPQDGGRPIRYEVRLSTKAPSVRKGTAKAPVF